MTKQEKRARSFAWPRGAVSTRVFADIDATTQEGRAKAFKAGATECLYGAKSLDHVFQDVTGEYILTFHALELALKAYLAKTGLSDKKLRHSPFRHNLANLYSAACERGLSISVPQVEAYVDWMNCYHDKRSLLRYEPFGRGFSSESFDAEKRIAQLEALLEKARLGGEFAGLTSGALRGACEGVLESSRRSPSSFASPNKLSAGGSGPNSLFRLKTAQAFGATGSVRGNWSAPEVQISTS